MKIATYERVSTIEQHNENQRPALQGWVQGHPGAVLVRPYRDVESGWTRRSESDPFAARKVIHLGA